MQRLRWTGGMIVAAACLLLLGCGSSSPATSAGRPTAAASSPPRSPRIPPPPGIGGTVSLAGEGGGTVQVTLLNIAVPTSADTTGYTVDPNSHLVAALFKVTNESTQVVNGMGHAAGNTAPSSMIVDSSVGHFFPLNYSVAPGDALQGTITWEVPNGSGPWTRVYFSPSFGVGLAVFAVDVS